MIKEIKASARRQLAVEGANLSLRAIARELGMVSSAPYRYFSSRDDLLTSLIIDAYNALGEAAEQADAACPRADPLGRFMAICRGVRTWALANPHEYALIYGSPVPGYRAPADTVAPAARVGRAFVVLLHDAVASGALVAPPDDDLPPEVRADLADLRHTGISSQNWVSGPGNETPESSPGEDADASTVPEALPTRGMAAWIQLFGAVSFELFGHLDNVVAERDAFFEHQMRAMARHIGLC